MILTRKSSKWLPITVLLIIMLGVSLGFSGSASASIGDVPYQLPASPGQPGADPDGDHQYINLSTDGGGSNVTGAGADASVAALKIYDTAQTNEQFNISIINRNAGDAIACRNYDVEWTIALLDSNERLTGSKYVSGKGTNKPNIHVQNCVGSCAGCGGYSFTIPQADSGINLLTKSNVRGHGGLYTAVLLLRLIPTGGTSTHSATFHISTTTAKIGFLGLRDIAPNNNDVFYSSIYPSEAGSNTGSFPSGATHPATAYPSHTIRQRFGVPCDITSATTINVWWAEADSNPDGSRIPYTTTNKSSQDHYDLNLLVRDVTAGVNLPRNNLAYNIVNHNGANNWGHVSIDIQPSHKYTIEYQNVEGGNGIALFYPFDSADYDLTCPPTTTGGGGQPPIVGVDSPGICPKVTGYAYDNDDLGASTRVDVYVDGPAGAGGGTPLVNYTNNPIYANELRPDPTVGDYHGFSFYIPGGLVDGGTHTFYVYAIDDSGAVSGPGPGTVGSWPPGQAYNGHVAGADPITVDTADCGRYYRFDPATSAVPAGTDEKPGEITFSWGNGYLTLPPISSTTPVCVYGIAVNYHIFKHPAGTPPGTTQTITSGTNSGAGCTGYAQNPWSTYKYTPPTYEAGDAFCASISISPSEGYAKTDGTQVSVLRGLYSPEANCVVIKNKPYFNTYGAGASAGGDFGTVCSSAGTLGGWNNNTSGAGWGAGSQLSALALTNIVGFSSGQRSSTNGLSHGLTFANANLPAGSITTDKESPHLGGLFGNTHCIEFPPVPTDAEELPGGAYQVDGLPSVTTRVRSPYKHTTGDLKLNEAGASGLSVNQNASIYVTGNVYIANNIMYGAGWSIDPVTYKSNIPSFVVYATGDIFIAPGVTQLDGRYIAKGKIYTCATGPTTSDVVPPYLMYPQCGNQLKVHGSFSATQVNLMRTFGSLRNATGGACSGPGGIQSSSRGCAAEVFDFSPEIYLAEPAIGPPTSTLKQYEAITSLPPVL